MAHLILHRHGGPRQGRDAEIEANSFASSFLMPKADVKSRLPFVGRLDELVAAKKRWGVSPAALAYHLHKLGILSDWQYRMFCIQINQRGAADLYLPPGELENVVFGLIGEIKPPERANGRPSLKAV